MIVITVVLDESGLLKSCDVRGHAGAGKRGTDIVCAAVSALARTALAVLAGRDGITAAGGPGGRGEFFLEIKSLSGAGREFLAGAGTFLVEGFRSVAAEFPQNCTLDIQTSRERL
ncbi:MAG: ribosomal-processing cysteine protease Prp [Spirochaetaceae bacterium]|jgi:uncharacterized protein YsxB (DUF464 family)|nr:ribosomal-processing cysteine protease Prp [Spirochaetaceae bacterium]